MPIKRIINPPTFEFREPADIFFVLLILFGERHIIVEPVHAEHPRGEVVVLQVNGLGAQHSRHALLRAQPDRRRRGLGWIQREVSQTRQERLVGAPDFLVPRALGGVVDRAVVQQALWCVVLSFFFFFWCCFVRVVWFCVYFALMCV